MGGLLALVAVTAAAAAPSSFQTPSHGIACALQGWTLRWTCAPAAPGPAAGLLRPGLRRQRRPRPPRPRPLALPRRHRAGPARAGAALRAHLAPRRPDLHEPAQRPDLPNAPATGSTSAARSSAASEPGRSGPAGAKATAGHGRRPRPSAPRRPSRAAHFPSARTVLRTVWIVVLVVLALYLIYLLRKPIGWLVVACFLAIALSAPINLLNRWMNAGSPSCWPTWACCPSRCSSACCSSRRSCGRPTTSPTTCPATSPMRATSSTKNETLRRLNRDYQITDEATGGGAQAAGEAGRGGRDARRHRHQPGRLAVRRAEHPDPLDLHGRRRPAWLQWLIIPATSRAPAPDAAHPRPGRAAPSRATSAARCSRRSSPA